MDEIMKMVSCIWLLVQVPFWNIHRKHQSHLGHRWLACSGYLATSMAREEKRNGWCRLDQRAEGGSASIDPSIWAIPYHYYWPVHLIPFERYHTDSYDNRCRLVGLRAILQIKTNREQISQSICIRWRILTGYVGWFNPSALFLTKVPLGIALETEKSHDRGQWRERGMQRSKKTLLWWFH